MNRPLILALPSKGRLKEQCEAWLAQTGLEVEISGGGRGYQATLKGAPDVAVHYLSAGSIAGALDAGEAHFGVTGKDLIRERADDIDERVVMLRDLGFGRADVVVAAHQAWADVAVMADLAEVARDYLVRTGGRMRVATKYFTLTRQFFAEHGIVDYRIVASAGATEGAPAAGTAEVIVDITTTGATLVANQLKILDDGLILRSQATLAASLTAKWTKANLSAAGALLSSEAKSALGVSLQAKTDRAAKLTKA